MKRVGKEALNTVECGFTATESDPICGNPTVLHAMLEDTWELISFASACAEHAEVLRRVADYTHDIESPCLVVPEGRFLVRVDGSSFCYVPEDDAELQTFLTEHREVALVGPLA